MSGAFAVHVRGWAMSGSPEAMACELLGPSVRRSPLNPALGDWKVEDPLPPEHPVGPVRSLVTFESDDPVEVSIVPGSHGQPSPTEEMGHELVRLTVAREQALVLDARCWYRVLRGPGLRVRLWVYQPLANQS